MFKKENLRKNLLRVKQNIDQNLGRAEKSEVLSEDQQENEKRVELVKHAFQNITKKAAATLQSTGTDFDKRLKKLPESGLSLALLDSAQTLGQESLLSTVCKLCGECQSELATEQVHYEIKVESEFLTPLQNICDSPSHSFNDIPSIIKLRKALNKSTLDMDSAKSRFTQAMRQSQVPGANMATAAAKADTIKEEYEDASLKVDAIKDSLSIELCHFASKESEQSQKLLRFLEAQAEYHRKVLDAIEQYIPIVQVKIDNAPCKPVYGMPLEEHLRLMRRDISIVIEACVSLLLECGLEEEGLFRIAGAALKLKKLKACFDAQSLDMEEFSNDPHTVAGALKQYLRELPEPLLTYALHDDFLKAASLPQDQRLQTLWTLIQKLPVPNFNNFRYLVKFLAKLAEKSDINKMKPSNIAIVIGPNLIWSESNSAPNMLTTGTVSAIIEAIVTHADWFFPGAFDFHLTGLGCSPKCSKEPGVVNSENTQGINNKLVEKCSEVDVQSQKGSEKRADKEKLLGEKAKILPIEQGFIVNTADSNKLRVKDQGDHDESSSDESNPFSEKFVFKSSEASRCEQEGINKEGERLPADHAINTNTGDYDNILYTMNPINPSTRFSTMMHADSRRASADNVISYGKYLHAPVPPCRPSRPAKKPSPVPTEVSCSLSPIPKSGSSLSVDTLPDIARPNSRYMIGSTPNITALPYHRNDDYNGLQSQLWNRPNQKANFNSLKRGSDPCIIPPPPQFNSYTTNRPLKLSRAHLGTPPKPGEMSRSQSSPHNNNSKSQTSQCDISRSQSVQVAQDNANSHNPVDKSFHQDTYSTAFALTSLGAGTKSSDYLTRVRAMWDDRHQLQNVNSQGGKKENVVSSTFNFTPKQPASSPGVSAGSVSTGQLAVITSHPSPPPEFDFSNVGVYDDQENYNHNQAGTQQASQDSIQVQLTSSQPVNPPSSPGATVKNTSNVTISAPTQESPEAVSSIQRRATRKPAPPPPPDRPFTVMVTATTALKPGTDQSSAEGNGMNSQTWPRSAPLASPESPSEQYKLSASQERNKVSVVPSERPSMPPPDRPERPRYPQTLNPPIGRGHQRSASTGAVMNQAVVSFEPHAAGVPNAELDLDSLQATAL